jgi:hypothetical protein
MSMGETGVGGRGSWWRWLALLVIPAAFALSVWSAAPGAKGGLVPRGPGILAISLNKTVTAGNSTVCASTDNITVVAGTEVTYCYTMRNTGAFTVTRHTLVDSELSPPPLLDDVLNPIPPGGSYSVKASTIINETTVNQATWTASRPQFFAAVAPGGAFISTQAMDVAQVTVVTPTPSVTPTPTNTPTPTPSNTPTATPTATATSTLAPTIEPPSAPEIPTLSGVGVAVMTLLLGAIAALHLARSRR